MVMAQISGGSISEGPSRGLRMLEKESTRRSGDDLGREDRVRSGETGLHCTADLVLFRFAFRSLLLFEETPQVIDKQRDNPGETVNLTMLMLLNI